AGAAEGGVVEVVPLRAHRAQREGDPGPVPRQQPVDIVREADGTADGDIDLVHRAPGLLRAAPDVLEEDVRVLRHEGCAEPAVRELTRQLKRIRAERREVDRYVRLRLRPRTDRFPLAPRQRQAYDLA